MKLGTAGLLAALSLSLASTCGLAADDETEERSAKREVLFDFLRDLTGDDDGEVQIDLDALRRHGIYIEGVNKEAIEDVLRRIGVDEKSDVELRLDPKLKFTDVDNIVRQISQLGVDVRLARADSEDDEEEIKVDVKLRKEKSDEEDEEHEDADDEDADDAERVKEENFIGVITRPVPEAIAHQLSAHLEQGQGLLVVRVLPESPAAQAGLQNHDVLVSYAGTKLSSPKQLGELIAKSKADDAVEIELLRAAAIQSVKVTVAQRPARAGRMVKLDLDHKFEFKLPKGLAGLEEERALLRQKMDKLREDRVRAELKRHKEAHKPHVDGVKISITSTDGKQYKVDVAFKKEEGDRKELSFEGTLEELLEKLGELPESIRDRVADSLKRLQHEDQAGGEEADEKRTFRFQFQPRVEAGDGRGFRIFIRRPGEDGKPRVFEFDQSVELDAEAIEEHLLELQEVREELEDLGPVIRKRVEETLRNIRIPKVEVEIEDDSQ